MGDQNVMQQITKVIEQILGAGLVVNGQVNISGLTVSSVEKARELGIVPQQSQQQSGQKGGQSQGQQGGQGKSSGQQGGQGQQQQSGGQISREEFNSLKEELGNMRKLMESPQQEAAPQRGRGGTQPKQ